MSRMYVATFDGVSVSVAQDLFEVVAPADAVVRIHSIDVSNEASETSEQLAIRLRRGEGTVTSGSGGSTPTPEPLSNGDPAFGGTVEANNTTAMVVGTGAIKEMGRYGYNIVGGGFSWVPTPECRIDISPSDRLVVNLPTAPGAALTMSGVIVFEEIGG